MYEPPEGTDLPWEAAAAAAEATEAARAARAAKAAKAAKATAAAAAAEAAEAAKAAKAAEAEGTEAKAEGGGTAADAKPEMRRQSTSGEKGAALASTVQIDPEDGDVQEQLRQILIDNAVRVIDLFRDWDDDGDGKVSKKEFRKAMVALGVDVPRKDVDALFDAFDPDGGGSIDYSELNKALKRREALDPSLRAGSMGMIELKAQTKSSRDLQGLSPRQPGKVERQATQKREAAAVVAAAAKVAAKVMAAAAEAEAVEAALELERRQAVAEARRGARRAEEAAARQDAARARGSEAGAADGE